MTGMVIWFTGLPASGKSTLAREVRERLLDRGKTPCLLDSDVIRQVTAPLLGYSDEGRDAFYEALAGLAAELASQGLVVLVAATAHRSAYRERARSLAPRFLEVWVTTPVDVCRLRDGKGLYAGEPGVTSALPGVGTVYEEPVHPDIRADGGRDRAAASAIVDSVLGC
jgi:adenylylsulfate kinase